MLHPTNQQKISELDYLDAELISTNKGELIDGHVHLMAGASANHDRIATNLLVEFSRHLDDSPCEPFGSDLKVKANVNFFYPDVTVVCGFDESQPIFTNTPTIVVEVLSQSTRRIDQTTKKLSYINLPTLQEYILIEQDFVDVEVVRRSNGWQSEHYFLGDVITLESIDLTISVEAIYKRVNNSEVKAFLAANN